MSMFTDDDRRIFAYQDGTRDTEGQPVTVYADPLEINQAMSAALSGDVNGVVDRTHEFDFENLDENNLPKRVNTPEVVRENTTKLHAAIRQAFGLESFDRLSGRGATGAMCVRIWNAFCDWMNEKKS